MTTEQRIKEMKELAIVLLDHAEKLSNGVASSGVESAPNKLSESQRSKVLRRRNKGRR